MTPHQGQRPVTTDLPSINIQKVRENKNLSAIFTNQNNRSTYRAYSQFSNDGRSQTYNSSTARNGTREQARSKSTIT
jgi:hypothetical protein